MHAQLASTVCKLRVSGHVLERSPPRREVCLDAPLSLSLTAGVVLQGSVYMHRHPSASTRWVKSHKAKG